MQSLKNKIIGVVASTFIVLIIASLFISIHYNSTMQQEINHRDQLIDKLLWSDSTLNRIMDIKYDSLTGIRSYTYRVTNNGQPVKYNQLSKELDSISTEVVNYIEKYSYQIKETNQFINDYNLLVEKYNTLVAGFNNLNNSNAVLKEKVENITSKYNSIIEKYNNTNEQLIVLQDSIKVHNSIINLIVKNYPINYSINYKGNYRTITVKSPELDSALMIYPFYKHKLTYSPKDSCWYIKGGKD